MKRRSNPTRLGRSGREKLTNVILEVVLLLVGAFYLYPVFLICINSVKTPQEMAKSITALPKDIQWSNYADVFKDISYPMLLRNTILVTAIGVVGVIVISSLAAYILNRRRTSYTKALRAVLIAPILIPFHTFMVMERLESNLKGLDCIEILRKDDRTTYQAAYQYAFKYISEKANGIERDVFLHALRAELGQDGPNSLFCRPYIPLTDSPLYRPFSKKTHKLSDEYCRAIDPSRFHTPEADKAYYKECVNFIHYVLLGPESDMP